MFLIKIAAILKCYKLALSMKKLLGRQKYRGGAIQAIDL